MHNYNDRKFRSKNSSSNAEVSGETLFHYFQEDNIVWANYKGGSIVRGQLLGLVDESGNIEMRYQHINVEEQLMTGKCISKPEILSDGRIRLHEEWEWTSGDLSKGNSVLEELVAS